jgi:ribonuclease G
LQADRARTKVLSISELGLVEMTRQRVRTTLHSLLCEPCTVCRGTGLIESPATIWTKIFRDVHQLAVTMPYAANVTVHVHPTVADWFQHEEKSYVAEMEQTLRIRLTIKSDSRLRQSQFEVLPF